MDRTHPRAASFSAASASATTSHLLSIAPESEAALRRKWEAEASLSASEQQILQAYSGPSATDREAYRLKSEAVEQLRATAAAAAAASTAEQEAARVLQQKAAEAELAAYYALQGRPYLSVDPPPLYEQKFVMPDPKLVEFLRPEFDEPGEAVFVATRLQSGLGKDLTVPSARVGHSLLSSLVAGVMKSERKLMQTLIVNEHWIFSSNGRPVVGFELNAVYVHLLHCAH
jgi:hypothetical protein